MSIINLRFKDNEIDLSGAYENKVKNEAKKGRIMIMTYAQFVFAWNINPHHLQKKYKSNCKYKNGYVMTHVKLWEPLSDSNYQIIPFNDVTATHRKIKRNCEILSDRQKLHYTIHPVNNKTKAKMREAALGKAKTPEHRRKISDAMKGKKRGKYKIKVIKLGGKRNV